MKAIRFGSSRIDDLPGATAYEQLIAGQKELHEAGLTDVNITLPLGAGTLPVADGGRS